MQTMTSRFPLAAPVFAFAGFNWPRTVATLPKGTMAQRLARYKNPVTGPYYHAPEPLGLQAHEHGFYLDSASAPGLRWKWCDEVDSVDIRHTGWFTDDDGSDGLIRGVVFRLPAGRGFLAGWSLGENMAGRLACEIHQTEHDAALAANDYAEDAAETEREYQAQQRRDERVDEEDREAQYRQYALGRLATDELEFEEDAKVSLGDDAGAWVQAWVWVPESRL